MKDLHAKMTFRLVFISFLALMLIGCGESGTPGGSTGPGVAASISLAAGDESLPADGVTSTTITAVLVDSVNSPVLERTSVVFRTNRGTFRNGKTEYKVKTPDASGTVTVTLMSDGTVGTAEVWVECNNISQKIEVRFYDPAKVGTLSIQTGSPSVTADGVSQVAVIATVTDYLGNEEEGAKVTFKTSLGQFAGASPLPGLNNRTTTAITDVQGDAMVMLVSGTTIGTATIQASINGLLVETEVVFTAGDPQTITLRAAPSTVRPNGALTLFAELNDMYGNPVAGEPVQFSYVVNESEGVLGILVDDTDVNGEAQATYTAGDFPGNDILQAALQNDPDMKAQASVLVDPAAIVIQSIDVTAGATSVVADPMDPDNRVNIRAIVTDTNGNPATSKIVNFSTTAGTLSSPTDTTDENGIAQVILRPTTVAGPVTVRAECDGFIEEVAVEFVAGPADHIILYAFPDIVPPGGAFETAAIVQDQYDNRIDDQRLRLEVRRTGNTEIVDSAEMTPDQAEDGVYRFNWNAATAYGPGNLEVTARVNNDVSSTVTVIVDEDAVIVGSITVIAGAEEVKADGTSAVSIRATVQDITGAPAQGVTVDFATTLGFLSSVQKTTDVNGIAEVMLKAGRSWGTATVTADANGFWGEVDVRFTSLNAGGVSITAMPDLVEPGGQATIIAELQDTAGSPVPGETLYFNIFENNTLATLDNISGVTDTNGRVTVTYTAGVDIADLCTACPCSGDLIRVTLASNSSVSDETCVEVGVSTGVVGYITLESDANTLPADDVSSTAVAATVFDTAGFAMPQGTPVTFTVEPTGCATFPGGVEEITLSTIDSSGRVITSLIAGDSPCVAEITATAGGVSQVIHVIIDDGLVQVGSIVLSADPESIPADGASSSAITATVTDVANNPVPDGTPVILDTTSGTFAFGTSTDSIVLYTSGGTGTVTSALIAANTADVATVTATAGSKSQNVLVTFTEIQVGSIVLSADPTSIPADGSSSSAITATVTDAANIPVPDGTPVTLSTDSGTFAFGTSTDTIVLYTSGGTGTVTSALIAANAADVATVTATAGSKSQSVLVTFTEVEDQIVGGITLTTPNNTIIADGVSSTTVQAVVTDTNGDPMPQGTEVEFAFGTGTTTGTLSSTDPVIPGDNGTVIISLISSTTPGIAVIEASAGDVTQSLEVLFYNPALVGAITLTADPETLPADGISSSTITATVTGTDGSSVPMGTLVEFDLLYDFGTVDLGELSEDQLLTTNDSGTVTTSLIAGEDFGTQVITVSSGTVTQAISVTIGDGGGSGDQVAAIGLVAAQTALSPNDTTDITALVYDGSGHGLGGQSVVFTLDDPTLGMIDSGGTTAADGTVTVEFEARSQTGAVNITATSGGVDSAPLEITIKDQFVDTITVAANPTSISVTNTSTISATVYEFGTIPVPNATVNFSLQDPAFGTITPSAVTNAVGVATATFTAANFPGTATIIATSGSESDDVEVEIQPAEAASIEFDAVSQNPIAIRGTGGAEFAVVTFNVKDVNGNPAEDVDVLFTMTTSIEGDEYLEDPNDGTPYQQTVGTSNGVAEITLHSGYEAGTVSIRASIATSGGTTITAITPIISIGGGVPTDDWFVVSVSEPGWNMGGLNCVGIETDITAWLADRFGNYNVLDGHTVSFQCETGLAVDPIGVTVESNGAATTTVRTQALPKDVVAEDWELTLKSYLQAAVPPPVINYAFGTPSSVGDPFPSGHPRDGVCNVLVFTMGEESFVDGSNSLPVNGIYDAGENFTDTIDDPWRDWDDDGLYDFGTGLTPLTIVNAPGPPWNPQEEYLDREGDDAWDGVSGDWDGASPDPLIEQKNIYRQVDFLVTGTPYIRMSKGFYNVPNGGADTVAIMVCDENYNPMSAGSTYTVSVSEGDIVGGTDSYEYPSSNFYGSETTIDWDGVGGVTQIDYALAHRALLVNVVTIGDGDSADSDPPKPSALTVTVTWTSNGGCGDVVRSLTIPGIVD